ncbi:hypothetical protein HYX14_01270 [Candidatus Woesearchaeota archaeon]|nr:hypothetical protein [Candidatus Woesearchaeota archaeon]
MAKNKMKKAVSKPKGSSDKRISSPEKAASLSSQSKKILFIAGISVAIIVVAILLLKVQKGVTAGKAVAVTSTFKVGLQGGFFQVTAIQDDPRLPSGTYTLSTNVQLENGIPKAGDTIFLKDQNGNTLSQIPFVFSEKIKAKSEKTYVFPHPEGGEYLRITVQDFQAYDAAQYQLGGDYGVFSGKKVLVIEQAPPPAGPSCLDLTLMTAYSSAPVTVVQQERKGVCESVGCTFSVGAEADFGDDGCLGAAPSLCPDLSKYLTGGSAERKALCESVPECAFQSPNCVQKVAALSSPVVPSSPQSLGSCSTQLEEVTINIPDLKPIPHRCENRGQGLQWLRKRYQPCKTDEQCVPDAVCSSNPVFIDACLPSEGSSCEGGPCAGGLLCDQTSSICKNPLTPEAVKPTGPTCLAVNLLPYQTTNKLAQYLSQKARKETCESVGCTFQGMQAEGISLTGLTSTQILEALANVEFDVNDDACIGQAPTVCPDVSKYYFKTTEAEVARQNLCKTVSGCTYLNGKCGKSEICTNLADDDGDGLTDCKDSDCKGSFGPNEETCGPEIDFYCRDLGDNDGDGLTDCKDPDCNTKPGQLGPLNSKGISSVCLAIESSYCADSYDNDADGSMDCADSDCAAACTEVCDGKDNNANGQVDDGALCSLCPNFGEKTNTMNNGCRVGDLGGTGCVREADLNTLNNVFLMNFGKCGLGLKEGDVTGDGCVNDIDLNSLNNLFLKNYQECNP